METVPAPVTASPTSSESRKILASLIAKLKLPDCRYHTEYSEFLESDSQLEEQLYRFVRADILTLVDTQNLAPLRYKKNEDLGYTGAAIYLHVVIENHSVTRFYVGQTSCLAKRLKNQHMDFRHRKEHPSLHYYALNHSDDDYYVTLAYVPKREPFGDPELSSDPLFLNLLEMWCCLMFRTLSKRYLIEFLPPDSEIKDRETEHLNIRLPLEQNTPPDWPMIQDVLRNSPDPLYKKYHLDGLMRYYRNDSVLLEYNRLIEKRCMELDKLSATHRYKSRIKKHRMDLGKPSAPSRGPPSPILPRLPLAGISQARRGPRVGDTNGVYAVTPASTVPRAVADSAKHYVGQDAAVNRSQTGYRTRIQRKAKRKWECVEETPSSPPRGQAVNRMYYLNSDYEQGEPSRGVKRATIQKSDSNEEWKGYCTDDLEISLSSLVL